MKMAKKFLAVALAGVLALSVLTGCGASVKSKDIADALTKMGMNVEQSDDMDKAAENALKAIEAIVDASAKDDSVAAGNKITLENAVKNTDGKVIDHTGFNVYVKNITTVAKALGAMSTGTPAETAHQYGLTRVALVNIENAKKDASLQAAFVKDGLVQARAGIINNPATQELAETGKLGTAKTKDGKYMLVVIVNDRFEKANG